MSQNAIDIRPVLAWLDQEVLPQYGTLMDLSQALAARSAGITPRSWLRQLIRMRHASHINFFSLDRLCCLLGEHVSRFCDLRQFEEVSR